ncbi:HlyD family efflux transporter periplasmic adaptor subunit [Roseibacterium beibuensis]|uniref:HlyD family efflux transporter periplasmic adaptor subunit n=1 Tax=[Roseibacterium] beibuensis TaxID=1193142 RepID=A0ABP9L2Q5_9RHOB|nr:HlyD family efflux transporter periplasmic adaptor subunit [Roseibacterium beibuensis]MCS6621665.1 HlyD family efflux transporter periplasmic adaptor subunit [Roseibacterium beibuensis]
MHWNARTILTMGVIAAALGGLFYVATRTEPVAVDLHQVESAPLTVTIDADGQTRIRDIFEVASPITGTARRAPVAVGDLVVQGDTVVARVEPISPSLLDARSRAQAEAAVDEAAAALDVARSDLTRAEEEEAFARMQFDRTQALVERGVTSLTQLETATQQLAVAQAAVAAARSRITMAEGTLERAEAALVGPETGEAQTNDCCVDLLAPADGVVLSVSTISEHPVTAGAPLLTIGDPGDLEIVADLLSSDAVRIGPGTRAIVQRWGGDVDLDAVLTRIEPAAETRVSALGIEEQRVDAIFDLASPPEARAGLGHGFSVFLRIVEWEADAALQVPLGALFRRGEDWAVFVVEDGIARERIIEIGQRGTRMAQVIGGLEAGEAIITHPSDAISDGVPVVDRETL